MALSNPPPPVPTFLPTPSYLFSATVNLGKSLGPIPMLDGSLRIVEPITGGTLDGPGFNGTLQGGHAAPIQVTGGDGTRVQIPYIYTYGYTSDGAPFYLEEAGIGSPASQTTKLIFNVGGKYEGLQKLYLLGQITLNEDKTTATVECFSVPLPP
ncbi:MAG: hypothetical protein Q9223_002820 [Gallowayella weberi]